MKSTLKDNFLANSKNKQPFINILSRFPRENNYPPYHDQGDADVLIAKTAVESDRERNTVLMGDDTIFLPLWFYTRSDSSVLYFKPEPKGNSKRQESGT